MQRTKTMMACETRDAWVKFLEYVKTRSSTTAFGNWLAPINVLDATEEEITLEIPNIFVKEYLLNNYKKEMLAFLPVNAEGEPAIHFIITTPAKKTLAHTHSQPIEEITATAPPSPFQIKLNHNYRFDTFIEGPANQFVKSAAMGVATRPGQSYNPLFIHGGVGLGKTHILHSIGHYVQESHKKCQMQCITTEAFINELVVNLKDRSIEKWKRFYRSDIQILLIDDFQFLQNRLNFEEEFCNMFETLINQGKQIVITSDKPPAQLKLSERMIARMEWGLVAKIGMPELETRVAIVQHKAQQKGLNIPLKVAFYIAEHIYNNVRQLEGAINRLNAQSRLLNLNLTEELVEKTLREMLQHAPMQKITVEQILKSVASIFGVSVSELKGSLRTKKIAHARQVAMYLAIKFIKESLQTIGSYFGRTHSTLLHASQKVEEELSQDERLQSQIRMVEQNITATG
jgi:chromosomal replication initiator protein